jgi:hypothetical protein
MKKIFTLTILAVMLAFGAKGAWAQAAGPFPTDMTDGTFGPAGSVTPNTTSGGPEIYTAINQLLGTSYTNNAQVDSLEYTGNASTWDQTSNGGYSVIGLSAWNSNTLEVYNAATPATLINPIGTSFTGNGFTGNGTSSSPYIGSPSVFPVGTQFGFAINTVGETVLGGHTVTTPAGGGTWYSNPTYNSDSMDHMLVYNLSSLTGTTMYVLDPNTGLTTNITLDDPYLLTFEDLPLNNNSAGSDADYNDLMVLVNGASPAGVVGSAPVPEPISLALFGVGLLAMAGFTLRRKLPFLSILELA